MQSVYRDASESTPRTIEPEPDLWRWAYVALAHVLAPFYLLRLAVKALMNPGYRADWQHRLGFAPRFADQARPIWIHAVSVGEAIAIAPLVQKLKRENPRQTLLVTTTTPTGRAQVERLYGDLVRHAYFPFDLPQVVSRYLRRVQPKALILIETEIWPELIHACNQAQVPVILANARMSPRSLRAYQWIKPFVGAVLNSVTHIAARSSADATRLFALGVKAKRLSITGNLKHAAAIEVLNRADPHMQVNCKASLKWIAGSIHADEDLAVLEAHAQVLNTLPDAHLIIAPRHPSRVAAIVRYCEDAGLSVRLRSRDAESDEMPQVYVLDTLGELARHYALADVAFVGGSLAQKGGQNPMEPVAVYTPVIAGPSVFNFESDYGALREADAMRPVSDAASLAQAVVELLSDPAQRARLSARAAMVLRQQQGTVDRLHSIIHAAILRRPNPDPGTNALPISA